MTLLCKIQFSISMKIWTQVGCAFFVCKKIHLWCTIYTFSKNNGILFVIKITKISFFPKTKIFSLDDTCSDAQIAFNMQSWSRRALKPHPTSIILKDNLLRHKFFVRMLNLYTFVYSYPPKGAVLPLAPGAQGVRLSITMSTKRMIKICEKISYKNVEKRSTSSCSKIQFWSWKIHNFLNWNWYGNFLWQVIFTCRTKIGFILNMISVDLFLYIITSIT